MRTIWLFTILLTFVARVAGAVPITFVYGDSFDTSGTSTALVAHTKTPNLLGDSHVDLEIDQDYGANTSEVGFFHFPYPSDQLDGNNVKYVAWYESAEDGTNRHCIRVNMCAQTHGRIWNGSLLLNPMDTITINPSPGTTYDYRFQTALSTAAPIYICGTTTPCTLAECANTSVRGVIYRLDSMPGCTSPSTAGFRLTHINIYHNQ